MACRAEGASVHLDIANAAGEAPPSPGGMGIGLLIARAIVEAHGGTLLRLPADGTVVHRLTLPLLDEGA